MSLVGAWHDDTCMLHKHNMYAARSVIDGSLLDAARRVLARHGYTGATAERIAVEAGLSRVTLHRRGLTKDKILDELAGQAIERYRMKMWPVLTSEGNGQVRLARALEALCESSEENMEVILALQARSDAIFHEPDSDGPVATRSIFTEPLERILTEGAGDGSLKERDAAETATVLFNLVGWTYIHLRTGHRWPPEQARDAVLAIAMNGVATTR